MPPEQDCWIGGGFITPDLVNTTIFWNYDDLISKFANQLHVCYDVIILDLHVKKKIFTNVVTSTSCIGKELIIFIKNEFLPTFFYLPTFPPPPLRAPSSNSINQPFGYVRP